MLDALRFVQGAIARKDFVPEMTHFHIRNGGVMTYNGALTLYSPIALNFDASPKAEAMIRAIAACRGDTITLHMTATGKLSIRSGGFKALVECYDRTQLTVPMDGGRTGWQLKAPLLPVLKKVFPFIGEDASRLWARGVLLADEVATATNNVILIQHRLSGGDRFPTPINIPKSAISEMLRIGEEPEWMAMDERTVTFHYSDGKWLRAQTYPADWPDLGRILGQSGIFPGEGDELTDEVWEAIEQLIPLADKVIPSLFIHHDKLATGVNGDDSASVTFPYAVFPDVIEPLRMNINQFYRLRGVARSITLRHGAASTFTGDNIRGAIIGMQSA